MLGLWGDDVRAVIHVLEALLWIVLGLIAIRDDGKIKLWIILMAFGFLAIEAGTKAVAFAGGV